MKNNSISKYVGKVRSQMSQNFNGANGNGGFRNFNGTSLANGPAGGPAPRGNWNANGGGSAMQSAPQYILQVSNASASAVANFDILGAAAYLFGNNGGGTWSNGGNFTLNGVTISSLYGTVSYQQILSASVSQPFTVGGVYLQSISGSANQVSDVYTLNSVNPSGENYSKPIKPYIDPGQFQAGISYNNVAFNVTGMTKLTWNQIYASAVFQITLFPAAVIDPGAALNQQAVNTQFGGPKVIGTLR